MRIIVCGAGKIGSMVVDFLHKMGHAVTVIDKNEAAILKIKGKTTAYCTVGNALYFEVLSRCGIAEADVILALTGDDAVNIAICQIAYSFFGVRIKVARIKNDILFYTKAMPYSFAPDFMFLPELILAQAMYGMLIYAKGVVQMPLMSNEIRLYTFAVHESGSGSIAKFNEKMSADGGLVALVAHRNGTVSIAAEMLNYEIVSGDILLIVSKGLSFVQLAEVRDLSTSPSDALLLVGKLEIVLIMLKFLTNKKQSLKRPIVVLAEDATEAQRIATEFSSVQVVTGNIFDNATLAGINLHAIGIALVATDDEVKNVTISAYFKKYLYNKPVIITTNSLFKDDFLNDLKIDMRVDTEKEIREFFSYIIEKAFSREVRRSILSGINLFELKVVTDGVFVFKDISVLIKQRNLLDFAIVYRNGTINMARQDFVLNPGDFVVGFSSNT